MRVKAAGRLYEVPRRPGGATFQTDQMQRSCQYAEGKSWERPPKRGARAKRVLGRPKPAQHRGRSHLLPDPAVDHVSQRNCYERHDFASLQA
jgi:hypothetical protein